MSDSLSAPYFSMAIDNPLWGEERIANELLVKLGRGVSPRTVRKYMPKRPDGQPRGGQRWSSFLRNQAKGVLACDFLVAVTATFELFYVFVVIEHGARRLRHFNLTQHPTAQWTLQQLRQVVGFRNRYRYLVRDRDYIYSRALDQVIGHLGLKTVRTPPRTPKRGSRHGYTTGQRLPEPGMIRARVVLGGLHHEYSWATELH